ncbi:MAG TPA: family 43 glycosylhydrolase [Oligoflexus sp.]|uniref:family 43 glycosylhydrolase n=1 Tax=Oligoflexus sp. TaxID=1971216 RepID=UPI002D80F65A|nr:family 43 glycosylhydrolase [Oligoflexus sp.]HET9236580.1 family 43 glycosylhydrolase [Oligoflexus sp.]
MAKNLIDIGRAPSVKVWQAPSGTEHSRQLWAAELHYLDGLWYIYYAASDGNNATHRMYVLESIGQDPTGPYRFKGRIAAATDRWAIDGTVLEPGDGRRYFVWSGWDGDENIQQNLYIAPMQNPWTLGSADPNTLRMEAEQANLKNVTTRRASQASGGEAVAPRDQAGSFLEFHFEMPRSGTYQLDIRYASGAGRDSTHEMSVNGGLQTLRYPPSGWNNFQTLQVFVPLVAGFNRIRFIHGAGGAELDVIEVKTIGSDRVVLSMPEAEFERLGGPAYINEGPQVLMRNGKIHIIYSASASWSDDYNLAQLSFQGGDLLNRNRWVKRGSVFARTAAVFAPGHASFTKSPDGQEMIYHAARYQGAGWDRDVRAQPFTWDAADNPVFGRPYSLVDQLPWPSGSLVH